MAKENRIVIFEIWPLEYCGTGVQIQRTLM